APRRRPPRRRRNGFRPSRLPQPCAGRRPGGGGSPGRGRRCRARLDGRPGPGRRSPGGVGAAAVGRPPPVPGLRVLQHQRATGGGGRLRPAESPASRPVNIVDPWPPVPADSLFGLANLPFGVFSHPAAAGGVRRVGVAVGESVLHLAPVLGDPVFTAGTLDGFLAKGRPMWRETRARLTELLSDPRYRGAGVPH